MKRASRADAAIAISIPTTKITARMIVTAFDVSSISLVGRLTPSFHPGLLATEEKKVVKGVPSGLRQDPMPESEPSILLPKASRPL